MFGAFCSVVSIEIMEAAEGAYNILHNEIHLEKKVIIFFQYSINSYFLDTQIFFLLFFTVWYV